MTTMHMMDMTDTMGDEMEEPMYIQHPDLLIGHWLPGTFLIAFGLTFLGLTVVRMRWLIARSSRTRLQAEDTNAADASSGRDALHELLEQFLMQHIPERSAFVLGVSSKAVFYSTVFGVICVLIGSRISHAITHLGVLVLYLFVGWTGMLESRRYLPADSLRAALCVALWGEALLWGDHGSTFAHEVDRILHVYMGLIAAIGAACGTLSVTGVFHHSPILSVVLHTAVFLTLVWQGCWFVTIYIHIRWMHIPDRGCATALLFTEGLLLCMACQVVVVLLVRGWRRQQQQDYQQHLVLSKDESEQLTLKELSDTDEFLDDSDSDTDDQHGRAVRV
mmetsp:Transcript_53072/g.59336  ORF Transcript_53072/g.59336 Transcript_53072/m.59336 type:complete len:334 (-) Transcript_53072:348-1349(-)|eukprot:CAMPEP_0170868754 /NCGR_PEP_ID=MMETSP0734-20130129/23816_1 /TAXON_ID=186038 /ORGANISM="Fragilariopsis kerguelensis, Strain L26-C5" /LENGTH=333 /DNA_ID=CAMNT_0011246723 /DNA_START=76 /DNA_END=1077 /DNA_ORIENTATION=+